MAYNTVCGDRLPCVALIVDDPTYDAGQNEGIAARLAKPIRVSGDNDQFVGIQIVYGNVSKEVVQAELKDKPLLVYSWVPRAEIMTSGRFVRITLESFYHCGAGGVGNKSALTLDLERAVVACDFAVEHVEKAVVWRLQQPESTAATLFVNAFKLNAMQLQDLLELGLDLDSSASAADLDQTACQWLNENTALWEGWLPDAALYSTVLHKWKLWLIFCGLCFVLVVYEASMHLLGQFYRIDKRMANAHAVNKLSDAQLGIAETNMAQVSFGQSQMLVRKSEQLVELEILRLDTLPEPIDVTVSAIDASAVFGSHHHHSGFRLSEDGSTRGARSITFTFEPLKRTRRVLLHIHDDPANSSGLCHFSAKLSVAAHGSIKATVAPIDLTRVTLIENGLFSKVLEAHALDARPANFPDRTRWFPLTSRWWLVKLGGFQVFSFALGQVFMQAIKGFLEVYLFESWLDGGLNQLSQDVTISCAFLMLTCKMINWRIGLVSSGKLLVQHQLQVLLLNKHLSMNELHLEVSK